MVAEAKEAREAHGTSHGTSQWTYVVGDVHGCYDELLRLEDEVRAHAQAHGARAFFVCVGDLLDRGPRIKEVVEHVRKGVKAGTHACVGGNHEVFFAETLWALAPWNFEAARGWPLDSSLALYSAGLTKRHAHEGAPLGLSLWDVAELSKSRWLRCGGRETLASFGCDPDDVNSWHVDVDTLAFLVGLPLLWESNRVVVSHAYVSRADVPILFDLAKRGSLAPQLFHSSLTSKEHDVLENALWNREPPAEAPLDDRVHVSGHTPMEGPFFDAEKRIVNVDTACVFGNMLTAFCVETGSFLSVPGWQQSVFR